MNAEKSGEDGQDELVSQFLSFTNTDDPEKAITYLEMCEGDLDTAVCLFMEHESSGMNTAPETTPAVGPTDATAPIPSSLPMGEDDIRAPDRTRTMRLMDFEPAAGAVPPVLSNDMMRMLGAAHRGDLPAAFSRNPFLNDVVGAGTNPFFDAREVVVDAPSPPAEAEEVDSSGGESKEEEPRGSTGRTLSDMFAPPTQLIHRAGGFQGARAVARDARRWLLVNLQRDSDFACHALNRDVWRDELVENLIREGFIFWQAMDVSVDGMTYAQRYNVHSFPHVAIIDPRTARLMWRKEGWTLLDPMTPETFAQIAADFCSKHTFDKPPVAPRSKSSTSTPRPIKRPIHEMTEEEQLQAAIRASMGDVDDECDMEGTESNSDDDVVIIDDPYESPIVENGEAEKSEPMEAPKPSFVEELLGVDVGEEEAGGARVQIRMPDGARVVRKFRAQDTVKVIYAFVAQSNDDAKNGKPFELRAGFPPRDLLPNIDNTVESCSLAGASLTVKWKTD